ncbi:MAG: hypothetical protein NT169_02870 [Chloroflexi bacterium]|nr:hypothetical protein [Chloroflexota bacterium]
MRHPVTVSPCHHGRLKQFRPLWDARLDLQVAGVHLLPDHLDWRFARHPLFDDEDAMGGQVAWTVGAMPGNSKSARSGGFFARAALKCASRSAHGCGRA